MSTSDPDITEVEMLPFEDVAPYLIMLIRRHNSEEQVNYKVQLPPGLIAEARKTGYVPAWAYWAMMGRCYADSLLAEGVELTQTEAGRLASLVARTHDLDEDTQRELLVKLTQLASPV